MTLTVITKRDGSGESLLVETGNSIRLIGIPICPDLLDYAALGEADRLRGRVIRTFFRLIKWWH